MTFGWRMNIEWVRVESIGRRRRIRRRGIGREEGGGGDEEEGGVVDFQQYFVIDFHIQ